MLHVSEVEADDILSDPEFREAQAAAPAPDAGLRADWLLEAMWAANAKNAWGEAIDTITRMRDEVAAEYAAVARQAEKETA
jgi:hypothetical protein